MGNFVVTLDEFVELMWVIPLPICSTVCSRGLASLPADTSRLTIRGYVWSGEKKDIPMQTRPIEQANEAVADVRAGKIIGRCVLTHAPREPSM